MAKGNYGPTEAYEMAGYSARGVVAKSAANRLLSNVDVRERIAELRSKVLQNNEASVDRTLRELGAMAYYNIVEILEDYDNGRARIADPRTLPEDLQRAIVDLKLIILPDGTQVFECKMADKLKALEAIGRHLQMFKDTVIVENVFRVIQDMDDGELDRRITELAGVIEGPAVALAGPREGETPEDP